MAAARGKSTGVVEYYDIDYVAGEEYGDDMGKLDIFMPSDAMEVPVLVYFHGGTLLSGSKELGHGLALQLAGRGIGVVSSNYRLSPVVRHPAHIRDAAASFAWVKKNIRKYGGDPDRIFVTGYSAGGYLAALLSLNPSYLSLYGMTLADIRGTILISAFLYVEEPEVASVRPQTIWGSDEKVWREASVSSSIGANKPSMLFLCANGDEPWRREQNNRLKEKLLRHGNSIELAMIADRTHSSINTMLGEHNDVAMTAIENFVKKHLA